MSLILTLAIIGVMAAILLIVTKPGHDRREKKYNEVLDRYIAYLEEVARPSSRIEKRRAAKRAHGKEDVPTDRD